MIAEALLVCALAQPPWSFLDPLAIKAKIRCVADLERLENDFPHYEWGARPVDDQSSDDGWKPSPWVWNQFRMWYRIKQAA